MLLEKGKEGRCCSFASPASLSPAARLHPRLPPTAPLLYHDNNDDDSTRERARRNAHIAQTRSIAGELYPNFLLVQHNQSLMLHCSVAAWLSPKFTPSASSMSSATSTPRVLAKSIAASSRRAQCAAILSYPTTLLPTRPSATTCRHATTLSTVPDHSGSKGKGKGRASEQALSDTTTPADKPRGGGRAKPSERELPLRKQFLLEQYKHLFSTSPVLVFLKPGDFTVAELTKLRVDLATLPGLGSSTSSGSPSPSADDINDASDGRPRYMHLRAGLLPPAFAALPHLPSKTVLQQLEADKGAIAVLTMDRLDPPILKAALAAVQKLSSSPNLRKIQAAASAGAKGKAAGKPAGGAPPGKAGAAAAAAGQRQEERLRVLSALIDGKDVPTKAGVAQIAALPGLQDVLAQLVSLIETPARQILGLTAQAGGQDLVRALEGFRVGLEAKEGEGQEKASPQ